MLFDYNKQNGGLLFNGSPIKNIISGINGERILGQGGNYRFLETIESTGVSSASMIDKLANTYKSAGDSIHPAVVQFAKDWENVDEKIKETTSMTEYFASQNTTAFQKLGSIVRNAVGKGFATLGNAIMSMGISLIASTIISKITEILTYYDRLKEETKSLVGEFESQSKSLHDNKTQYDELSQRYVELSKGVDALGHNLSLTTEEYDEYKSVVSQLVDLNPNLLQGYNDQNDAILTIKDSVDALTESYNENIKAANNTIIRGKDKIGENYAVNMNSFNDADFQNDYDKLMATKAINDILTSPVIDEQTVQSILDQYGNDVTTLILSTLKDADFTYDSFETTAALIARASKDSIGKSALEASLSEYEATINEYTSGLNDFSQAFVENQIIDNKIDDNLGAIIKNIVSNKDADYFNQFVKEDNTFDFNALERDLLNVVNAFKGLTDEQIDDLQLGINLSTQWNNDELSYKDYITKVQEFIKLLETLFPDNKEIVESFKIIFDIPDEEEIANKQDIFVNRLGEKILSNKISEDAYAGASKAGMPSDVENQLKTQGTEVADVWYDSLTKSEREFVDNLSDEDLAEAVKFESTEQFDEWLDKLQSVADSKKIEVKTNAGATENLDAMKTAFDDLETAYLASVKNQDSSGNATNNIASAADIQGVNDAFGGVTEINVDTEISDINALSNALEAYDSALIENKGNSEAAQEAADKLATAYVDQTELLDDLTEANKDYYIQQLKENGIENAEQVINTRLSKQYQKTREALENLSKSVAKNRKYLDAGVEAGQDYDDAISNIKNDVQDLLSIYDDNGEINTKLTPEIDDTFIKENLADIEAATEGDIDALDRLRLAVARINAAKAYVDIDLPSDVISAQLDNLMDKVAQVDAMDIEVGATVDDTAFIATLQNMIASGQTTADAVASAFESMGYDVEWIPHPYTVQYVKAHETDIKDSKAYNTMLEKANETIDMPSLKITRTSKASGAKVNNYSGGSNSSSSSGGSGGSDSGSSDDTDTTEETFDWIEVKISRLEEELDHLDRISSNVYNNWSKRNQTIADEIDKTTDEIKLQNDAAERYLIEANKYGDLIGEDYKKKVQEGTIDIETIELEVSSDSDEDTLIDNIQNYQTWWEKYKDALNNAETLTENIMEYHKDIFDNIQSQYESLIGNLDKQTDILEERVTRAEEMGFFTDKSYYEEMLKIEQSTNGRIEQLKKEREELINKLNTAMDSGFIQPESEGWWEMYDAIQDVNQQLEEAYTNVEKLKKEIEQLAWDKFDWLEERLSDITAESDFLIKLLQGENNFDDQGNFINRGYSQAALVAVKYDDALERAERYKDEIAKIDAEMAKDDRKADKDLVERKETLVQAYRDAIEAAEDEKQAMVSLVTEGINKQLEALKKLIDEYKESLSAAKDLYTYQKNLSNQTQNLADLQKQLAAYQNDDSEEARKKRQELQAQIESAEEQLEETQWDRYISETGEVLDNLYETYEEFLNEKLEQHLVLMNHMIDLINQNGTSVAAGLDEIREEYNLTTLHFEGFGETANSTLNGVKGISDTTKTISTNISKLVEKSTDIYKKFNNGSVDTPLSSIGKIIQDTWKTLNVVVSTDTNGTLNQVEKNSKDVTYNKNTGKVSVKDSKNNNTSASTSGGGGGTKPTDKDKDKDKESGKLVGQLGRWRGDWDSGYWYEYDDGSYPKDTAVTIAGKEYYFDPNGYVLADQYVKGRFYGKDGAWDGGETSEWKQDDTGWWYESQSGNYPTNAWVLIDGEWYYFGSNGYAYTGKTSVGTFDSNGRWLGYAKGTRHVPKDLLALTQEEGSELIYKTDTGAMLTPLNQGDMVFTHEMSQRLWQIASGEIPMTTLGKFTAKLPNVKNGNITANSNITFNLPNVTNAEQFMNELTQSSRFEKIIQEISIGQLVGNNKLNKYKY